MRLAAVKRFLHSLLVAETGRYLSRIAGGAGLAYRPVGRDTSCRRGRANALRCLHARLAHTRSYGSASAPGDHCVRCIACLYQEVCRSGGYSSHGIAAADSGTASGSCRKRYTHQGARRSNPASGNSIGTGRAACRKKTSTGGYRRACRPRLCRVVAMYRDLCSYRAVSAVRDRAASQS